MTILILAALSACGTSSPSCTDEATVLADGLTCAEARVPTRYLRVVAGRPLPAGSTDVGVASTLARHSADPVATGAWLADLEARGRRIEGLTGLEAAEARSHAVWEAASGSGPISENDDLWNLQGRALSVLAMDDTEQLALTEEDIEGWIRMASLLHEVQGKGVLTVSIANRADVYTMTRERFVQGDRAEKVALTSLGVVWPEVSRAWKAAPAAKQQRFIRAAALPSEGSHSSLAFVEAVLEGDLVTNAHALHDTLGPLHFRDGEGTFPGARP